MLLVAATALLYRQNRKDGKTGKLIRNSTEWDMQNPGQPSL